MFFIGVWLTTCMYSFDMLGVSKISSCGLAHIGELSRQKVAVGTRMGLLRAVTRFLICVMEFN